MYVFKALQVHSVNDSLGSLDSGLMGSIMLAALLSVFYMTMSASVLIGGWCSDSAEVHTWYGAVTTSSLWLGVVYIQAGMSSSGFMDKVRYTLTLGTSCTTVQGHIAVLLPSLIPWKGQRSTCKESPTQWMEAYAVGSILGGNSVLD